MKTTIGWVICLVFFVPLTSHSWFFVEEEGHKFQEEVNHSDQEMISSWYFLPFNSETQRETPCLLRNLDPRFHASADGINVDIPVSKLSKQTVDMVSSLDRQIAANLRIRNILEEYLAVKNRARLALKDLDIPYLESNNKSVVKPREADIRKGRTLEKEIENISLYSIGYVSKDRDQRQSTDQVIQMETQLQKNGDRSVDPDRLATAEFNGVGESRNPAGQRIGSPYNSELPWIFQIILRMVQFVYSNKLEILLWSGVFVIIVTLAALVVRK